MTSTGKPLPSDWATGIYWHEAEAFVDWALGQGWDTYDIRSNDSATTVTLYRGTSRVGYRVRGQMLYCRNAPHLEQPLAQAFLATLTNRKPAPRKPATMYEVGTRKRKPPLDNGRCVDCHEFALICEC